MAGHKLRRPPGHIPRGGGGFLCCFCTLPCRRLCLFGIPAFQFPFLLHPRQRIAGKLRVLGGHLLKLHIGPGLHVPAFPLCHLPGRVLPVSPFGIPGQFPGSGLGHKFRLMGSFHTHIFMLNFVDFVVEIKPCFGAGSPDSFLRKPRRLLRRPLCFGLVQPCPGLSQLFPGVRRFVLCLLVFVFFPAARFPVMPGVLRTARVILLPHTVRGAGLVIVLPELASFGLRAMLARSTVLSAVLVLEAEAFGWCGRRPLPVSRWVRPLKIPFIRFLSDGVSLLSEPRASMARSVLRPLHFLFLVLRSGGHNGVELRILREVVYKWDSGVPVEQQPFAGIGVGHIGKLVGADTELLG